MLRFILTLALIGALPAMAQEDAPPPDTDNLPETTAEPAMTPERLGQIVTALDPDAQVEGPVWRLHIADVPVLIITDVSSDRMRAMAPVREAEGISSEEYRRMMQANFDSALDARYAIAKGMLWSAYIHPLSPLEKNQLISGLGQVANLALSYGTLYSGGALQYRGGDSGALQRSLIDELLKKGQEI